MRMIRQVKNVPLEIKASFAYTVCSVIQQTLSILTLPLFTRVLTKAQYGQFSVYSSWLAIIMIFTTLNLPYGSFNTALVKFEDDCDKYISSIQGICIGLTGIAFVIYLPFSKLWNHLFTLPTLFVVIMLVEAFATASLQFWFGKQRFDYKYKGVVLITLLISVLSPLLALYLVSSVSEKGYARIFGYSVVNIVIGVFFAAYNLYKGGFRIQKKLGMHLLLIYR